MLKKIYNHKIEITIIVLLTVLLLGTNIYWMKKLENEKQQIKRAIIPSLSNDYFTNQLVLTKDAQLRYDKNYYFPHKDYILNIGIKDTPLINQNPDYPNGCEAASATMLLNYYGVDISLKDFITNYLPRDRVEETDGIRYGPNPALYYAGNPADQKRGWGCFDTVIESTIQKVFRDYEKKQFHIATMTYNSESKYPLSHIALMAPAIIWVTIDYEEAKEIYEWSSYDKKQTYTYPKNSHTVVLTGYDYQYYYINDPLRNEKNIPVDKAKLERSYDSMGRQAIYLIETNIY